MLRLEYYQTKCNNDMTEKVGRFADKMTIFCMKKVEKMSLIILIVKASKFRKQGLGTHLTIFDLYQKIERIDKLFSTLFWLS